ncbi:MLO-like protein 1 isoform X2 [Corylus avellana]|uniref:MLO-like protein 1 isoform X2 n=1 Tax=Corylus avellana TaxID=13451 RepID=UPI00286B84C4|nr:MLO-like protein 1 isoform X2 [Corylus avellana]
MAGGEEGQTLEYTPTWVVAVVCSVIVLISLSVERILHYLGKYLKKNNQKPLFEALQKIKEELMLLGFISLLLVVFQTRISKLCISEDLANKWLPCDIKKDASSTSHFQTFFNSFVPGATRRLLAEASASSTGSCKEGKVPLLSITALHHLHIFIFVLAVVHVTFCALTILFGGAKIRLWKRWEDAIQEKEYNPEEVLKTKFTDVQDHAFIRSRFLGFGKDSALLGWLHSFFKQFYGSVSKTDYMTLRLGFIMTHCRGNLKYNFHKYMIRTLEADFKKVVGISWYLWVFVVIFLLLNVSGWHAYFWIAFFPFVLLLAVGTKLEHVITQLALEVAEKHVALPGALIVQPSDDHFWFHRPRIVLLLIHIILFQNSFEMAFFFWIWAQYGFDSCIMGEIGYIIPRLVIGVFIQFVCSYSTLPLYAIVTQMGTSFKKDIFEEHIQEGIVGWAQQAKKNKRKAANGSTTHHGSTTTISTHHGSSQVDQKETAPLRVQMAEVGGMQSAMEEGNAGEIEHATVSHGHK